MLWPLDAPQLQGYIWDNYFTNFNVLLLQIWTSLLYCWWFTKRHRAWAIGPIIYLLAVRAFWEDMTTVAGTDSRRPSRV